MWDSPWVVSTMFVALFVSSVLYGISIQLQVKWHIATLSLKLNCHSLHVITVVCTTNVWWKAVLWSPASKMLQVPMEYQTTAGYDSSPHPSLALIMSFNAWSSINKYPILKPINKYLIWSSTNKYLFWGTHIKVHLLSSHRLNQVKRDCACMCSFSFSCLHVSAFSCS